MRVIVIYILFYNNSNMVMIYIYIKIIKLIKIFC